MKEYFLVALGFYCGAVCVNFKSLKGASILELLNGWVAALFFPVTFFVLVYKELTSQSSEIKDER
jgi:hypothetical protein